MPTRVNCSRGDASQLADKITIMDKYRKTILLKPGRVRYQIALDWQFSAAQAVRNREIAGCLALLEHPAVYTMGARGGRANLLVDSDRLGQFGADVVDVDRGGDITFHGPGQLVAYPILRLSDYGLGPSDYVHLLEQVLIDTVAEFGVLGTTVPGRPGVWVGPNKLAAIGVRVQKGVTRHGVALNVHNDLSWFGSIIPCGLPDGGTTSLSLLLNRTISLSEVEDCVIRAMAGQFDMSFVGPLFSELVAPDRLINWGGPDQTC